MIDENGVEIEVHVDDVPSLEPDVMEDTPVEETVVEPVTTEDVVEEVHEHNDLDPGCDHENTEVRYYNKKTLLGELWCKICGGFVKEYDNSGK